MLELETRNVQLQGRVSSKKAAIREVGNLLVNSQYIKPGYIDSMLAREKVANTYLGSGVAIPHGLPRDRELILKTGIAVLQVPDGVEWNPGETVHLVIGIAARSDEHLEVLANLTRVLGDEELIGQLSETGDRQKIISHLSGAAQPEKAPAAKAGPELAEYTNYVEVTVQGTHGLHARPATNFVELAKQFKAFQTGEKLGFPAYSASKAALAMLVKAMAVELAPAVRCVGIAPGHVQWPASYDEKTRNRLTRRIPMGRVGTPEDVARLVRFLALEAPYVNGDIIKVDGGLGSRY